MHATRSVASQALAEDETHVAVGSKVTALRSAFRRLYFLCVGACDEDGAAVLQVLFNRAEIYLVGFLNGYVLVGVVVE